MRRRRVPAFFGELTQQIHSLRASGASPGHTALTAASVSIACRKSAGSAWTVPPSSSSALIAPPARQCVGAQPVSAAFAAAYSRANCAT